MGEADKELAKKAPVVVQSLVVMILSKATPNISSVMDLSRYSTLCKLLRVTAIVFKFIDISRRICSSGKRELTAADLARANRMWVKSIKDSSFVQELQALLQSGPSSPLNSQLNLFLDPDDIIRCQGHIGNADTSVATSHSSKTPILLPSHGHYTNLLIQQKCCEVLHNGIRNTIAVRESHWIVKG